MEKTHKKQIDGAKLSRPTRWIPVSTGMTTLKVDVVLPALRSRISLPAARATAAQATWHESGFYNFISALFDGDNGVAGNNNEPCEKSTWHLKYPWN